jgi:hypothetical protein
MESTMRRILVCLAIAAAAAAPAAIWSAGPATAAPMICDHITTTNDHGRRVSDIDANPQRYIAALRDRGVITNRVEDWNGCVRAYVETPSGTHMQYYDPETFARVG